MFLLFDRILPVDCSYSVHKRLDQTIDSLENQWRFTLRGLKFSRSGGVDIPSIDLGDYIVELLPLAPTSPSPLRNLVFCFAGWWL